MNKVLIISTNAIGDTFLSFSAIESIKKSLSDCSIDFVVDEKSNQLFNSFTDVNKFITVNKNLITIKQVVSRIRLERYKFSLNFFPGRVNSFINCFSGAKKRAGYFNLKKDTNWYLNNQSVVFNGKKKNKYCWRPNEKYLERISLVLQSVGISATDLEKIKPISNPLIQKSTTKQIVIHPFSRFPERSLSKKTLLPLIEYLLNSTYEIEIICSSLDSNFNILKSLNFTNLKISADQDLKYLVEDIYNAQLFIAVDSFPLHIADAYNSSFLGILGPTNCNSVLTNSGKGVQLDTSSLQNVTFETILPHIERRLKTAEHSNE